MSTKRRKSRSKSAKVKPAVSRVKVRKPAPSSTATCKVRPPGTSDKPEQIDLRFIATDAGVPMELVKYLADRDVRRHGVMKASRVRDAAHRFGMLASGVLASYGLNGGSARPGTPSRS